MMKVGDKVVLDGTCNGYDHENALCTVTSIDDTATHFAVKNDIDKTRFGGICMNGCKALKVLPFSVFDVDL
jgi:hypothetical protein